MANDLQYFTPEYWSRRAQVLLRKALVGRAIANFEEQSLMRNGDIVHRPYHSDPYVATYTKGTAVTIQDITTTDEYLTVDQSKVVPVYVDDDDIKQNKYNVAAELIDRSTHMLARDIDSTILALVTSAALDVDDGDIGGTSGNPISLSTSNAVNVFGTAHAELGQNNVEMDRDWYLVIDPKTANVIMQTFVANGFNTADLSLKNGFLGDWLGFKVFLSNSLRSSVSLGIATDFTDGDTVVINGVTFTAETGTPTNAGDFKATGTAATSVDNLVAAINGTGTPGTSTYIALSAENRAKLKNNQVVATDNTTSIGIVAAGRMTLSETLTAVADGFGTQTVLSIAGRMGGIDAVIQTEPSVNIKDVQDKLGKNYLTHTLYGTKMFVEGAQRTVEINLAA